MRFNCFKKSCFLFLFLTFSAVVIAQESAINTDLQANFHKAMRLYNNKAYAASQELFRDVSQSLNKHHNLKADADYYDAMCAIKLQQDDADDRVMAFVENHPYNNKKEKAFLNVGNYYFDLNYDLCN